jgi:hypothetical protein
MRTIRGPISCGAALLALGLLAGGARRADAQQTYPETLYWGVGLMDIPVAWISPVSGDFSVAVSGQTFNHAVASPQLAALNGFNTNFAMAFSIYGRAQLGLAIYSDNPEWGLYGQGLILDEEDFRGKTGAAHWVPSLAVGLRNIGPYDHVDRYTIGYELFPGPPSGPAVVHEADSLHMNFKTANTLYGVVTKSFALSEVKSTWGQTNVSISLGYGDGLFSNDGGLGKLYSNSATGGIFGGVKVDIYPNETSTLSFMLEQNAWQWNLGANYDWRGLRIGFYWMNMFPGTTDTLTPQGAAAAQLYNYSKFAISLNWQSNVLGVVRGDFLQQKEAQLKRETAVLQQEIVSRQQRIASLELEIQRYEAQNLLELEQRRAGAEQALRQEKEALQRLEERLQKLEQNQNAPPAPVTPPSPPPASPPQR